MEYCFYVRVWYGQSQLELLKRRGAPRRAPGSLPPVHSIQYYPTALVATTERPRTGQWMAPNEGS
eukprot:5362705-Prymnesium_polylepis.1